MKDAIIFTLLALDGICIIGMAQELKEKQNTKTYEMGFKDAVNVMIKLYDIAGSQVCDLMGKATDGVDLEIVEDEESKHDYN